MLRIKVAEDDAILDFQTASPFSLIDQDGNVIFDRVQSDLKWRVRLTSHESSHTVYALMVGSTRTQEQARKVIQKRLPCDYQPRIRPAGSQVYINEKLLSNNVNYQILIGEFNTFEDAQNYGWHIHDRFDTEVIREKIREPRGIFEVFDEQLGRSARINTGFKLVSNESDSEINFYLLEKVTSSKIKIRDRFTSSMPAYFMPGDSGLLVVSEVPLEAYLKRIIPFDLLEEFPFEALKCQAIASRSWTIANLGLIHSDEPFDLCSGSHCQRLSRRTETGGMMVRAAEETHGEFVFYKDELCETPYTWHCGGRTSPGRTGFNHASLPNLKGIFDGPNGDGFRPKLENEAHVTKWVRSKPDVYCNPSGRKVQTSKFAVLGTTFRWEVVYTRQELEDIIREKTGSDIGTLFDIIPVKRSQAGRLIEIEILASRRNLRIKRESRIRSVLSRTMLNSGCFVIEKESDGLGNPLVFIFVGAGQGHGAGLCQTGAMFMALDGKSYKEILRHYFKNTDVKKAY